MDNLFLFKEIAEIPKIPTELIQRELSMLDQISLHHINFRENQGIKRDDNKSTSAAINTWWCSEEMQEWARINLFPCIEELRFGCPRKLFYREVQVHDDVDFYSVHFDSRRHFALIYNIVDSAGDITFWKHRDFDLVNRNETDENNISDYSKLTKIQQFSSPVETWYMINTKVYHSVENLKAVRKNFQTSI